MGAADRITSGPSRPWGSLVAAPVPESEPEQLHEQQARITQGWACREEWSMQDGFLYAGIDVSNAHLDVAVRPDEAEWRSPSTDGGVSEVAARLNDLDPGLVVLEATGGMEIPIASALAAQGVPVVVVNP